MSLTFRESRPQDIPGMFKLRARTRENPLSRAELAVLGITAQSSASLMSAGHTKGWVCLHGSSLVGFCTGDTRSGEILVVAVSPDFEGRGIGKRLLGSVVESLRSAGCTPVWLGASADPNVRSYGFYRHLGWQPTGQTDARGDEILRCGPDQDPQRP